MQAKTECDACLLPFDESRLPVRRDDFRVELCLDCNKQLNAELLKLCRKGTNRVPVGNAPLVIYV